MAEAQVNVNGIGLGGGAVFIVFLVLKLCEVINWSWWWITAPLWGPLALVAAIFILILVFGGIGIFIKTLCGK
jgi:hypothetical protein